MIGFCPLASGSKGNSIYFGSKNSKILIDAGLTFLQLRTRLQNINVDIKVIEAVLITHEHLDHIAGLKILSEKLDIPIFANSDTAKAIYNNLHILPKFKIFTTMEAFEYKDLKIFPFSVQHDTLDPVGFVIQTNNLKFGFCADLGFVTSTVINSLKDCDYLYMEANHHIPMVQSSVKSYIYKQRVLSKQGHLSNESFLKLIEDVLHPNLKHIHLAHISQDCNSNKFLVDMMTNFLRNKKSLTKFSLALQDKVSNKIELN